jgi:hypothetical protein
MHSCGGLAVPNQYRAGQMCSCDIPRCFHMSKLISDLQDANEHCRTERIAHTR